MLQPGEPESDDEGSTTIYHIHAYTTDTQSAGTDANVYITIYGDNGITGKTLFIFIFFKLFLPYCGQVVTGGRNRSTRRKPPPNPKSLATFSHVMDGI